MTSVQAKIREDVLSTPVILFMKGTSEMPQCGFSAVVVQILKSMDVPFKAVNVLTEPEIRQGIKEYASWPTIPQLYIKGEFIGGSDIVRELYQSGELLTLLKAQEIIA
ncbi:MAG: Grx4 family monothiol glutaredoxin [Alphaproteobacteria bacterium]|nr:Grx4 family monothiol glutaredoxin [Alphaproteobacteria bacterium]